MIRWLAIAAALMACLTVKAQATPEEERGFLQGPPRIIEAIDVRGRSRTSLDVILRRVLVREGDLVEDSLLQASRLRLLGTGYFSKVEFRLERGSRRGDVILVIELEERSTLQIDRLYLGTSEVSPLFGAFGVADSNFLGRGVTLGATFAGGDERQAIEARTFIPSLGGSALQLSASALALRGRELLEDSDPGGTQLSYERLGGMLGVGFSVGPAQRFSIVYRLELINAQRLPNLAPSVLRGAPSIQFDDSVLSTFSLGYERDTRDDPFIPTSGEYVNLSVELGTSLVGSNYEFSKYFAELDLAFEPFAQHSLRLQGVGGLIQGQTPFFNQFFIGDYAPFAAGRDSLPRAVQLNFSEANDYDDLLLSGGVEYAVPLYTGRGFFYRVYAFALTRAVITASLDEAQEDPGGRSTGGFFPLTFDLGLKMDTRLGTFTLSSAYVLELFL